jgi:hypothetical protein
MLEERQRLEQAKRAIDERGSSDRAADFSVLPEIPKPITRQRGIAHGRGNAAVAKIVLDSTGILAIISQLVAAATRR